VRPSLGICIPVWNRGELLRACLDSLFANLDGIDAELWLIDNGSDPPTRDIVYAAESPAARITKLFLPRNMGIPHAVNLFAAAIREPCDLVQHTPPRYVMLMDADAYFIRPVRGLVEVLEQFYACGIACGHDSLEHPAQREFTANLVGVETRCKVKANERMLTMVLKREEFLDCCPFPHFRNRDVDWELAQWHRHSMHARRREIVVACDHVLHLGIDRSTWSGHNTAPHSPEESRRVAEILAARGVTPADGG
jgi:glycosyltransferase involved in cell wall biosynthesis